MFIFFFIKLFLSLKISPISVKLDYNGSINGLIRKLQQNYSPIESSGILQMSASSFWPGDYPKNVLYDDGTYFHTNNGGISGEYLQFDFLENLISISSYTIKSRESAQSKNWKVNASIDGIKWITIDEVIEDLYMCSNSITKTFKINNQNKFKFIRFISTGLRCGGDRNFLNIYVIEFFGSINLNYSNYMNNNKYFFFNLIFHLIFFFL